MRSSCTTAVAALALLAPAAAASPRFKHVIVVFQENRTPDNLFGSNPNFEPGVDIAASGVNSLGQTIPLTAENLAGCYDVNHMNIAFAQMYDGGKMDGADREQVAFHGPNTPPCHVPANPQFKYVGNAHGEIQPYFDLAAGYGWANRMFQTNQGPSFPAHQFIFGGTSAPDATSRLFAAENMAIMAQTATASAAGCTAAPGQRVALIGAAARETDYPPVYPCLEHETLADLLDRAGLRWRYYLNGLSAGSIWNAPAAIRHICQPANQGGTRGCAGAEYTANVPAAQGQVLSDIAACALPSVSWVIPNPRSSDHAAINDGSGPDWVASIVNAVGERTLCHGGERYWHDTVILITWDDWGGWYDHVPPFRANGWPAHHWGVGYTYGFRVPLLVVSAFTPAGTVDNAPHDFGSILRFTEQNFGLKPIGAGTYADAFATGLDGFFANIRPRPFAHIPTRRGAAFFLQPAPASGPGED